MSSFGSRWFVYCSIFNLIFYVAEIQVSNLLISNSVWSSWSFFTPHPIYCHLIVSFKHVWLLIVLNSLSWSTRHWSLPTIPVKVIWKRQRRCVKCRLVTCNFCNHFVNLLSLMCQCCCSDFNFILTKKVIMTVTLLSGLTNWHKDGLLCYIMQKEVGKSFYVSGVYISHRLQLLYIAPFFSYTCMLHRLKSCSWYNVCHRKN